MNRNLNLKLKSNDINLPNILTTLRILIIPFFIIYLFKYNFNSSIVAYILFLIASVTDYFDGYIARKYKITSQFGAFLDPLSDKLLTGAAFISFYLIKDLYVPLWLVGIIIFREILVTAFRIVAIKKSTPMKTEFAGKLKTAFQMFTINIILLYQIAYYYVLKFYVHPVSIFINPWSYIMEGKLAIVVFNIPAILTLICAILSLTSMVLYITKNRYLFKS